MICNNNNSYISLRFCTLMFPSILLERLVAIIKRVIITNYSAKDKILLQCHTYRLYSGSNHLLSWKMTIKFSNSFHLFTCSDLAKQKSKT